MLVATDGGSRHKEGPPTISPVAVGIVQKERGGGFGRACRSDEAPVRCCGRVWATRVRLAVVRRHVDRGESDDGAGGRTYIGQSTCAILVPTVGVHSRECIVVVSSFDVEAET